MLIVKDSKRPHGQAVKTSPSHGGIWGSIPHGGTKKILHDCVGFLLIPSRFFHMGNCTLCVRGFATRTPEHWAGVQLYKPVCSFHYYAHSVLYDSPWGYQKNPTRLCGIFTYSFSLLSHGELHTLCAWLCHTNPRTLGWRSTIQTSLLVSLLRSLRSLRFPMGVPEKDKSFMACFFYLFILKSLAHGELCVITHATMLHEPQNTGLAFHSASKLARFTITLTLFSTIPHGGTKKSCTIVWDFYLFLLASSTRCLSLCIGYSSIYHKKIGGAGRLLRFVFGKWCLLKTC